MGAALPERGDQEGKPCADKSSLGMLPWCGMQCGSVGCGLGQDGNGVKNAVFSCSVSAGGNAAGKIILPAAESIFSFFLKSPSTAPACPQKLISHSRLMLVLSR